LSEFAQENRVFDQNLEHFLKKPKKTGEKPKLDVDKALQRVEGEWRRGSPHPHEHWRFLSAQRSG
jgi:hypothetical protein